MKTEERIAVMKGIPTEEDLVKQLQEGVKIITFDKKDGSERVMTCTKSLDVIPKENHPGEAKNTKEGLINVWDTNAQGWRSFYYDRVKKVTDTKEPNADE